MQCVFHFSLQQSLEKFRTQINRSWSTIAKRAEMRVDLHDKCSFTVLFQTGKVRRNLVKLSNKFMESRWGEIFRTCPDRPWGQQPPIQWVPGLSRGIAAVAWRWSSIPSSAEVKGKVELHVCCIRVINLGHRVPTQLQLNKLLLYYYYNYSPCGPSWPVLGWALQYQMYWEVVQGLWRACIQDTWTDGRTDIQVK